MRRNRRGRECTTAGHPAVVTLCPILSYIVLRLSYDLDTLAFRLARLAPEHARTKPFGQASSQLIPRASPGPVYLFSPVEHGLFSCLRGSTDDRCDPRELWEGRSPTKVGDEPCTAPRSAPTACSPHVPHAHGSPRGQHIYPWPIL